MYSPIKNRMMWPAEVQAFNLPYRSTMDFDKVDAALDLLEINDHTSLLKTRSKYFHGKQLTWAKIADATVSLLARPLLNGGIANAVEAHDRIILLEARLQSRDASGVGRVTSALRQSITALVRVSHALAATVKIKDGTQPDDDMMGRLVALKQRWYQLKNEHGGGSAAWVVELVQRATAEILKSSVGAGKKALATRAAAQWIPDDKKGEASDAHSDGEVVQWDDDF